MNSAAALNIQFNPLLPIEWIVGLAVLGLLIIVIAAFKNRTAIIWRGVTLTVFVLALLNPSLLEEQREALPDVAVIVVDQSPSQSLAERSERTEKALEHLESQIENHKNIELRIIKAPASRALTSETLLFSELEKALVDVPPNRRAGVIFISDGQIHDVPLSTNKFSEFGPVHILLSGQKKEKERQLVILQTPSYGIIDQSVNVKYRIEDTSNIGASDATITITTPNEPAEVMVVPVNQDITIDLPIMHAGQNVYEISVQGVEGELTEANNRAALIVNGVRDRLKVLLVSGKPHAGGRTWRDLLTSDPGVDLVHFTILREPSKLDATPQNELALIAFPFRELFEIKLYDFDLIIFDRYQLSRILPDHYFDNIARYVEEGGAFLEASGPSFAGQDSIYQSSLRNILPGAPTGEITKKSFKPKLTDNGTLHPVTRNLKWETSEDGVPEWGNWLRQVRLTKNRGDTLMSGSEGSPLLILDRVGKGRVAQIASDHIWLWSRGYDGGGPHAELLRRVIHWLMKEPELDERALNIHVREQIISLKTQSYKTNNLNVEMTKPDGSRETIEMETSSNKVLVKTIEADQLGVYSFETSHGQTGHAIVGDLNQPELRGVRTTTDIIAPALEKSGGGAIWLSETQKPKTRHLSERKDYTGRGWLAFRKNNQYRVSNVISRPLLPPVIAALILLGLLIGTWWREGREA